LYNPQYKIFSKCIAVCTTRNASKKIKFCIAGYTTRNVFKKKKSIAGCTTCNVFKKKFVLRVVQPAM